MWRTSSAIDQRLHDGHTRSMSSMNELGEERWVGEQMVEHVVNVQRELFLDDVHLEMFMFFALCNVIVTSTGLARCSRAHTHAYTFTCNYPTAFSSYSISVCAIQMCRAARKDFPMWQIPSTKCRLLSVMNQAAAYGWSVAIRVTRNKM